MTRRIKDLPHETLGSLETDWKMGLLSKTVIAAKWNVAVEYLEASAIALGWNPPDLRQAIAAAHTKAVVTEAVHRAEVARGETLHRPRDAAGIVAEYGGILAKTTERHRAIGELGSSIANQLLEQLKELAFSPDTNAISTLAQAIKEQDPKLAEQLTKGA